MRHLLLFVALIFFSFQVTAQNVGIGTTSPAAKLEIASGGLLISGITGTIDSIGAGTRLMWIPAKHAFRAGEITGTEWDDPNIGLHSFTGGGFNNIASHSNSFVGGGVSNAASNFGAFVGGGAANTASGFESFIGGGNLNTAEGLRAFAGGGRGLSALGDYSFVGGGWFNTATGPRAFVGGGGVNIASGHSSFIGGGQNLIARSFAEVVIGTNNTDYNAFDTAAFNAADRLFVIGNGVNTSSRSNAMTVLKNGNVGFATDAPIAVLHIEGGALLAQGSTGSIDSIGAGTRLMWMPAKKAFRTGEVSGTQWDDGNVGTLSFVGGGEDNTASGLWSFVGGGSDNMATGQSSYAGGGLHNTASASGSFIGGGADHIASGSSSFIGGGIANSAMAFRAFIGGGQNNIASGRNCFIGGGEGLLAKSYSEAVFGTYNLDYTPNSTMVFDSSDRLFVIGNGSFAARSNAITVLKNGNLGIGSDAPGEKLHVAGNICFTGTIAACSDIRYKKDFLPIPNALHKISSLNGVYYDWKQEEFPDKNFASGRQIGVIAQEVQAIFPEVVLEDADGYLSVDYSRLTPVLIEAVKEQQQLIDHLQHEKSAQASEIDDLKIRMTKLEGYLLNEQTQKSSDE